MTVLFWTQLEKSGRDTWPRKKGPLLLYEDAIMDIAGFVESPYDQSTPKISLFSPYETPVSVTHPHSFKAESQTLEVFSSILQFGALAPTPVLLSHPLVRLWSLPAVPKYFLVHLKVTSVFGAPDLVLHIPY